MSSVQDTTFNTIYKWAGEITAEIAIAGAANIPTFRYFAEKNGANCGTKLPINTKIRWILRGIQTAPSIGASVGLQLALQKGIENFQKDPSSIINKVASAALVGLISSPFLAAFNGQLANQPYLMALRKAFNNPRIIMAITLRETSFIGALVLTDPVIGKMRAVWGDFKGLGFVVAGFTALAGAALGQIPDCISCRLQNNLKVIDTKKGNSGIVSLIKEGTKTSLQGTAKRVQAVVSYSLCYYGLTQLR